MKKSIYTLIVCTGIAGTSLHAQIAGQTGIAYDTLQVEKVDKQLTLTTAAHISNLSLKSQNMVVITPILQSKDEKHSVRSNPFVVTGPTRMKAIERETTFGNSPFEHEPALIIRYKKKEKRTIPMRLQIYYEDWMRNASLTIEENNIGCLTCDTLSRQVELSARVLPPIVDPVYELIYVVPPVEEVKVRSEKHSAYLNFEVGKAVLLRDFRNNASELANVNRIVNEVHKDANLKFTEFTVTGYASPEGSYESNMRLSENRARAFAAYMKEQHDLPASLLKVNWEGGDWGGLRHAIQESSLSDREQILDILCITDINRRKAQLRSLNNGRTYRMLLEDYFPSLRRIDYTLAYIARPFDVNEAKLVIQTKPQYLSLNEMFLVANTYPKDSPEFKEVFDIAVRLYSTDPVAQQNTAALEIERDAIDAGIKRLEAINTPEAWNNLGVAYAQKKEYQKALDYFSKAANAGVKAAIQNQEELSNWLKEQ